MKQQMFILVAALVLHTTSGVGAAEDSSPDGERTSRNATHLSGQLPKGQPLMKPPSQPPAPAAQPGGGPVIQLPRVDGLPKTTTRPAPPSED